MVILCETEKCPELGEKFSENKMSSLLFDDDFVGIDEMASACLMDIVHNYNKHGQIEVKVKKMCLSNFLKLDRVREFGFEMMKSLPF